MQAYEQMLPPGEKDALLQPNEEPAWCRVRGQHKPNSKTRQQAEGRVEGAKVKGTGLFSALHSHGSQETPDRQGHRTKLKQEAWVL